MPGYSPPSRFFFNCLRSVSVLLLRERSFTIYTYCFQPPFRGIEPVVYIVLGHSLQRVSKLLVRRAAGSAGAHFPTSSLLGRTDDHVSGRDL